jgi:hypothetical protein
MTTKLSENLSTLTLSEKLPEPQFNSENLTGQAHLYFYDVKIPEGVEIEGVVHCMVEVVEFKQISKTNTTPKWGKTLKIHYIDIDHNILYTCKPTVQ